MRWRWRKPVAKAYWWRGTSGSTSGEVSNFGDALAPLLLTRFADFKQVDWHDSHSADIFSVGSVLEHVPAGFSGYILGSGLLRESSRLKFDPSQAKLLAVRGPLSARVTGLRRDMALGDPGLLANELVEYQEKQWDLGIVPHWQDEDLVARFQALIPSKFSVRVILPSAPPLDVIRDIAACRRIVTSSLHGMIVADAIGGIPRRVEYCSKLDKDGARWKYMDYAASIHHQLEFGKMQEPSRNHVNDRKSEIWSAYRELSRVYGR